MKKRFSTGNVFAVPFGENRSQALAVVANIPEVIFFDRFFDASESLSVSQLRGCRPLFRVCIMASAFAKGRWSLIGQVDMRSDELTASRYAMFQSDTKSYRVIQGDRFFPSDRETCIGLEPAAAWYAENIEERLDDHFNGRENRVVKMYFRSMFGSATR